jgi:ATP-dependent helicase/nuclease subunit B
LEAVLTALGDREKIREKIDRNTFFSALGEHLHAHEVPVHDPDHPAVEVLNAMDARAKRFEALVVMGLQEGVWPWRAPEDPFLTDGVRQRIAGDQNVRLLKKSAGHEEERLLFTLALTSAHRFVTLTWQRSAEDGRPLVRSWFVHETARALGRITGELAATLPIPRRLEDRFREKSFQTSLWTPSEWAAWLLLHDQSPVEFSRILGFDPGMLERCFDAGQRLKHIGSHLTDRDGITGKIPELWKEIQAKGWSPTSLEAYARCPFQFFANRVLGLEELEDLEEVPELGGLEIGNLLHDIFQRFFSKWKQGDGSPPFGLLSKVIEDRLDRFEGKNPVGYPLLWRMMRADVKAMAEAYVAEQAAFLMESGFRPFAFEQAADAVLPNLPSDRPILRGLKIAGRLDRIDRRETQSGSELRVVDYKFTLGKSAPKRNLEEAALQGQRLQPAFYVLLAQEGDPKARPGAELHYLAPKWPEKAGREFAFSFESWQTPWAEEMGDTLERLLKGIREGEFYILPDEGQYGHCSRCPYQVLCRKNHRPTRYRQTADPRTHSVEGLSKKRWKSKG